MKALPANVSFPKVEESVLELWDKEDTFHKSLEIRKDNKPYIFYDGPPFATGLPHYGHILTSYIKDTIPRYFTMRGFYVDRRWGWDCHGLPVEYEVEKRLNISGGKKEIEKFGIDKFNAECRGIVLRYAEDWEKAIHRIGRWVDFERQYRTMDLSYMESIMWVFSELYKKGLIYEKLRVVTYCNRCQTALSNFEAGLDDSFREREDPSVTVRMRSVDNPDESFLAWTTTPWTLPSNLALGVHEDIDYGLYRLEDGESVWIAVACADTYKKQLAGADQVKVVKGKDLIGRRYLPPFEVSDDPKAFVILHGDFIETSSGTGMVHLAPAFGEDDHQTLTAAGVQTLDPVGLDGKFTAQVGQFAGQDVFEANPHIIRALKEKGILFHREQYRHNYPHCWRCDNPLIYRTINSWYVAVKSFRDDMVAYNREIQWVPNHIRDGRFGQWLEGARDWSISRNRYWGSPIPVWRCTECDELFVSSSLADLEEQCGHAVKDLHRPHCDEITWDCKRDGCSGKMQRVPEVLDCWFESGGMPYAQVHYPFENKKHFQENFPASFIVEYVSQTRGWFYTLHVESSALMKKPPFLNAICHGVLLAEDGRKLSKRLRNFADPAEVIDKYGSDALRVCLLASPIVRGQDIRFSEKGVREVMRRYILPLWNVSHFYTSFADIVKDYQPQLLSEAQTQADRYILSELEILRNAVIDRIEAYDLPSCYRHLLNFIETLSGWYVRNNRPRFWVTELNADAEQAFNTLYTVLYELCLIAAPFMPFVTDYIFRNFSGESVHLQDWPEEKPARIDRALMEDTQLARSIIETVRKIREKNRTKLRQPLSHINIAGVDAARLAPFKQLIMSQGNIKDMVTVEAAEEFASLSIQLVRKTAGPALKKDFGSVSAALAKGEFQRNEDGTLICAGRTLERNMYQVAWQALADKAEAMPLDGNPDVVVCLALEISRELRLEGYAREINRHLQDVRKKKNFAYDARVDLAIHISGEWQAAFAAHRDWIFEQLLVVDCTEQVENPDVAIEDKNGALQAVLTVHE